MTGSERPSDIRRARRAKWRAIFATIVTVLVTANAIIFDPDETRRILQLAVTALGVVAMLSAAGVLRRAAPYAAPSPLDRLPPRPRAPVTQLPPDLVRISRRIAASEASASDTRRHLGPIVSAIAADRIGGGSHRPDNGEPVFMSLPRPVAAPLALVLDPALAGTDTRAIPGLDGDGVDALVVALERL